ncbi:peptide chain release factor 1 [Luteibaculum oceani]|uniref:Peptide chain release factor 1 n=1 Tax=Luteibaculum oceani TaxID=1294296 RepID=A0A5C6VEQ8_9FLAO|nr:peptide chain release factor 1 [Luteibaculum oceani]TXC81638.1 peptide chain release factor 1 [Luteibaculum oceani]
MSQLLDKLQAIKEKWEEVGKMIVDPDIIADNSRYAKLSKEYKDLEETVKKYDEYKNVIDNIASSKEILSTETDPEFKEMAEMELKDLEEQKEKLDDEIKFMLIPKDPDDNKNVIMEIRAGTGGDEASIFCGDLFRMYSYFIEKRGWKQEIMYVNEGTSGGYKEVSFQISGDDVYSWMKYESGVHRVQRVPKTESQGRVHTSASTVAVLPEAEEIDFQLNMADVKKDTFRASGAGGQHVNKTESAVRLTHIPTNTVVECQDERSQIKNNEKALKMLRTKLYEAEVVKREQEQAAERKSQVSTGDRSAKIRTYNFPQGRCTDHRIGLTLYNLDNIMNGDITEILEALKLADNMEKLKAGLDNNMV